MVEDILESTFEVIGTVGNGKSPVESALRLKPDVIIADISMPILNGFEAAKQLRESGSRAKIVFLTVHSDPSFVRAGMDVAASGFVVKDRRVTICCPRFAKLSPGASFFLQPRNIRTENGEIALSNHRRPCRSLCLNCLPK
jgi:DNA-binding NarL/FixJ family response regulator